VHEDNDIDEEPLEDKEMELFVHRYHRYLEKNGLNHSEKNLINFRTTTLKGAKFKKE
jgi:DNA-binding transcriptional LysR family regulator